MWQQNSAHWKDLSRQRRGVLVVLAVVQFALAAGAWLDLARRGRDQIVGTKTMWTLLICVNFAGPIAYFVFGRRQNIRE